jgi:hypothetical protein
LSDEKDDGTGKPGLKLIKGDKPKIKETEKKLSFKDFCLTLMIGVDHLPSSTMYFREREFPDKYHIELSPEGVATLIRELPRGVMEYVSEERFISAVVKFCDSIEDTHPAHWCDHDKAKRFVAYWKDMTSPFPQKIHPVLQYSTPGYTWHRLDFDMKEEETPTFDYLVETLDTNKHAFMGFIGALFDSAVTLQQYLWITGDGGDGKGALFRLLSKIFGDSYTSIDTDLKNVDKYWASALLGKRVGVAGDITNLDFINSSTFKGVTGGDHVSIRRMHRESYTVHLNTMFILGANADPFITSEGSGLRRAIICRMDKNKYRYIENFEGRLWDERAGIVFRCVMRWREFKKENPYKIPVDEARHLDLASSTEERHQYYVDEYFQIASGLEISASRVIAALNEEKRPLNNQAMGAWKRFLERVHGVECRTTREKGVSGTKKRYFGMGLREFDAEKGAPY